MKKNKILISLFSCLLLLASSCLSQENNNLPIPDNKKVSAIIVNVIDENRNPIQAVSIVYLKHNIGTISDISGQAIIPYINDSLKVSCVGFRDTIFASSYTDNAKIFITLKTKLEQLETVNVFAKSTFNHENLLGFDSYSNNYIKSGYGNQIALKVNNSKLGYLKSIKLNHLKLGYVSNLKIEIKSDVNGFPSNKYVIKDTVITTKKGEKFTQILFNKEQITINEGFFYIIVTNMGLSSFKNGDYIKYSGQTIQPYFILVDHENNELTYLNYLNRKWTAYPKFMNKNNEYSISNVAFSCKILQQ